jgi:predicted DNA-binding protein (MmcQ/YjbR family)
MTLEDIRNICIALPDVTEDIKWGNDICFNISGKMFFVTSAGTSPTGASFKVGEEDFELLIERNGFGPAPYLARHKWVWVDDIGKVGDKEWKKFIEGSYKLVKAKLKKKR